MSDPSVWGLIDWYCLSFKGTSGKNPPFWLRCEHSARHPPLRPSVFCQRPAIYFSTMWSVQKKYFLRVTAT